jgi:hypothetical protein
VIDDFGKYLRDVARETTTSWCSLPVARAIKRWKSVSSYSVSANRSEKVWKRASEPRSHRRYERAIKPAR